MLNKKTQEKNQFGIEKYFQKWVSLKKMFKLKTDYFWKHWKFLKRSLTVKHRKVSELIYPQVLQERKAT